MKISTQKSEGDQKCNQKFMKNSGLKITLNGDKVMTMGESAEKAEVRKRKDYLEGKKRKRHWRVQDPGRVPRRWRSSQGVIKPSWWKVNEGDDWEKPIALVAQITAFRDHLASEEGKGWNHTAESWESMHVVNAGNTANGACRPLFLKTSC